MPTTPRTDERPAATHGPANGAAAVHALEFGKAWDYAPAPETVKVSIAERYGHFVDGTFTAPRRANTFATTNPATESKLADIAQGTDADVDAAVRAAAAAQHKWAALKPAERAKYLFRIARRIQERARELAILESMDGGKPIKESRDVDIPLAAAHFFYHAGWADKLKYAFPGRSPRPIGVCGQIIPWNFPMLMAAWKLAPALACGNTCVLKPAEDDAADGTASGGDHPGGRPPCGRGQHHHRRWPDGRCARKPPGRPQDRFHRVH